MLSAPSPNPKPCAAQTLVFNSGRSFPWRQVWGASCAVRPLCDQGGAVRAAGMKVTVTAAGPSQVAWPAGHMRPMLPQPS